MPYNFAKFQSEIETMSVPEIQQLESKYLKEQRRCHTGARASIFLGPLFFVGLAPAILAVGNAAGKLALITRELDKRNGNGGITLSDDVKGQLEASVVGPSGPAFAHAKASEVFGYSPESGLDDGLEQAYEARKNGQQEISVTEIPG